MQAAIRLLTSAGRWVGGVLIAGFLASAMLYLAPGGTVDERELDPALSEASRAVIRSEADRRLSLPVFYAQFMVEASRGNFGDSAAYGVPVNRLIADRWQTTAVSVGQGWAAAWLLGLFSALAGTRWRRISPPFTAVSSTLVCLPSGLLAVVFFISGLPVAGILAAAVYPRVHQYLMRLLERAGQSQHCVAARARGVGPWRLLLIHRAWPVWPEAAALAGVTVSTAIGAAIPAEALCDVPGLGQLAWKSALARDLRLLVTLTLIISAVTLAVNMAAAAAASGDAGGARRWRT